MMEKKVAIVTGGTRGMGEDISLDLAKNGYFVLSVYRSNRERALSFLEKLQSISPESDIIQGDVSKQESVAKIVEYAIKKYGRIDVLINNAGIFDFKFIEDMTEEYLDNILSVNFKSQFLMTKACVPHMKKNAYGRIINASSISGTIADVGLVGYATSKASVNMFTVIAAAELAPYNITVNAYAPSIIHTDLTDEMIRERGDLQRKQIPLNRFGEGREVAALTSFLASPEASYITGEIIGVGGGFFKVQNPYRAHEYVQEKNKESV